MLGIGALVALGNMVGLLDSLPAVRFPAGWGARYDTTNISSPAALRRASFNHSVIPGGAFDAQELARAVDRDPVVAEHYSDVDPAMMRAVVLTSDRLAYVSYRLGDRVYWTSQKVRIRSGETILTNGQTEIRGRCGNCISMEPALPTSADEPDPMELDALTDIGPILVSWPLNPFAPLAAGGPVGADTEFVTAPELLPLVPFGITAFPIGSIAGGPDGTPPGSSLPGIFPDSNPGDGTTPPGGVNPPVTGGPGVLPPFVGGPGANPPSIGGPTVPGVSVDNPFGPFDPRAGDPTDSPGLPPTPPITPTPVPEPGTFLLLGGGIAGLIARRWRSVRT